MQHKRIERLLLFAEVATQLNFAKAAEVLGISKGYLSDQIKRLENEYSTPLLVRSTRSVRLTSEGQRVLSCAQDIKGAMSALEQNLNRLDGKIRITAPCIFAEQFLLPLCQSFRKQHPEVQFDLNTSYTNYDLNQANFDMAFRATRTPPDNMVAKSLFSYTHTIAASPDYLADKAKISSPYDLNKHACLTGMDIDSWPFKQGKVTLNGDIVSNDNHLLKQLAIAGEGIIRLPDYYVKSEIAEGKLQPLLEKDTAQGYDIYLLYPTSTRETARLRRFIHFVVEYFESL